MKIREVQPSDAKVLADIYNYYISNTIVTFEEVEISEKEMLSRITDVTEKYPWLVLEDNTSVVGYAYSSAWKSRGAYRYSAEVSVYLRHGISGKGYGSALYEELFKRLDKTSIHSIIGGVALPNDGCEALHRKFGFTKVAHFKQVGYKFEKWIDVVYWQKIVAENMQ